MGTQRETAFFESLKSGLKEYAAMTTDKELAFTIGDIWTGLIKKTPELDGSDRLNDVAISAIGIERWEAITDPDFIDDLESYERKKYGDVFLLLAAALDVPAFQKSADGSMLLSDAQMIAIGSVWMPPSEEV